MSSVQLDVDSVFAASQDHALYRVLQALSELALGESVEISHEELRQIGDMTIDGFAWTAVDLIMSGPVENAFLIMPSKPHPETGVVCFTRNRASTHMGDWRTWVAPDRRDEFAQRPDGYWERRTLKPRVVRA